MSKDIEEVVREKYAAVAASTLTGESSGVQAVAEHPGRGEHGPLVREPDGDR
jgi:hypothetical protein